MQKHTLIALALACAFSQPAAADEYYRQITTAGAQTLLNITGANTPLIVGHKRVVHALIITNIDTNPVTVTLSKTTAKSAAAATQGILIVPAGSTQAWQLPSGISLNKTKTAADDLEIELTTSSSAPAVDLTIDYLDI
jgi:hypothetical protein